MYLYPPTVKPFDWAYTTKMQWRWFSIWLWAIWLGMRTPFQRPSQLSLLQIGQALPGVSFCDRWKIRKWITHGSTQCNYMVNNFCCKRHDLRQIKQIFNIDTLYYINIICTRVKTFPRWVWQKMHTQGRSLKILVSGTIIDRLVRFSNHETHLVPRLHVYIAFNVYMVSIFMV